jgi:hypothetical protein
MTYKPANRILAALLSEHGRVIDRHTFEVPEGYVAVRDAEGRATGEIVPADLAAQTHVEAIDHTELHDLHRHDDDGGPGCPHDRRAAQEEARKHLEFEAMSTVIQKSDHGTHLPTDAKARKALPICTGVLDYFPDALAAVAEVSRIGNDQHNPGQPLHWSKGKSTDHADCALRHFAERYEVDTDGGLHGAKAAWRMLADLQISIEAKRAGMSYADYIAHLKAQEAA